MSDYAIWLEDEGRTDSEESRDRYLRETSNVCAYSARHKLSGVPAVTVIECGPVGKVAACQACAEFYARMS